MDLSKGTKLGNYELVLRIGRGGMATVWVARERTARPSEDRLVAVKAMLADLANEPEFVRMFHDEVRLIRAIRHPNIVDVYDVGENDGIMWMAMEWVEGESLHSVIAEAGKRRAIPPEIAVRIIADAAAGLHSAHELRGPDGQLEGVVHRDVSPHNILISTSGAVKLVDFGVAKAMGRLSETTRAGQLKGKFGYMSPEQARGGDADRRSDVFALGIVLYELTTSRRLFRGKNDVETLQLVASGAIPRPSRIDPSYPPALERIVLRALERSPDQRYQTAAELESDLRGYLKSERIVVPVSGVAGLLKRVLGTRIEQRRKAVRKAIKSLETGEFQVVEPELISQDPAFTPTGNDSYQVQGVGEISSVSEVSSLSQIGLIPAGHTQPTNAGKSSLPYFLLLLVVIATVLGVLVAMNKLKIPGITPASRDAGSDEVSTIVDGGVNDGADGGVDADHGREETTSSVSGPDAASTASGVLQDGGKPAEATESDAGRVPTLTLDELEVEKQNATPDGSADPLP